MEILIAIVIGGALITVIFFACLIKWRKLLFAGLAILAAIPTLYLGLALAEPLIDARYRTYRNLFNDIRVGMTRDEVMAAVNDRYPSHGPRKRPTIYDDTVEHLGFFMNPEVGAEPNCEGISLTLKEGRVTQKRYSPD
jgi:hypothetical protein